MSSEISKLAIFLLKGVIYRENDSALWDALLNLQAQIRDYMAVLNLQLVLDEAEGYAFLRSCAGEGEEDVTSKLPRLIARRPLSFPVSLLLALLRKKLAELDATGGETRLILSRDDIVDLIRVFLSDSSNEAKLIDQLDVYINKLIDLGFLRRLKVANAQVLEVQRILKAFVDAQWLADFDARLALYQSQFTENVKRDHL